MGKQVIAQEGADSLGRPGGKILADQRKAKACDSQYHHDPAHDENILGVPVFDAHVNDLCHHKGDNQFKNCFQQFKKGAQDYLFLKVPEVSR